MMIAARNAARVAAESARDGNRCQSRDPAGERSRRGERRVGCADAPNGASSDAAESNEQRDARRMIEVAGREMARPLPVVRLVGEERDERGEDEPDDRRDSDDDRAAPQRAVAARR